MTAAKTERNKLILQLHKKDYSLRRISEIVDISHERVRQILKLSPEYRGRKS